jgi:hypothetical protein
MAGNAMERIFLLLNQGMSRLANIVKILADDIEQLESIGGGGSASIEDYVSNKTYKRNTLLVDTNTETVYRVCCETEYTSVTVDDDRRAGNLKLVGFESAIVTLDHSPTQAEVNALPQDTLVAIYSTSTPPYPVTQGDNPINTSNDDT